MQKRSAEALPKDLVMFMLAVPAFWLNICPALIDAEATSTHTGLGQRRRFWEKEIDHLSCQPSSLPNESHIGLWSMILKTL